MDLEVEINNFVYPICIPETPKDVDFRIGDGVTIAGWGATGTSNRKPSSVLRETRLNIFSQLHCKNSYTITSAALQFALNYVEENLPRMFQSDLFCAGYEVIIVSLTLYYITK